MGLLTLRSASVRSGFRMSATVLRTVSRLVSSFPSSRPNAVSNRLAPAWMRYKRQTLDSKMTSRYPLPATRYPLPATRCGG